jgi:hypothetical protein
MLKSFLRYLSAGAASLALAGCCANSVCVCNDELADALYFSFQLGGAGGFRATDVDTLLVTRITHPDPKTNATPSRETKLLVLPLTSDTLGLKRDSLILNNASPFASAGRTTKLDAYDYRIVAIRTRQVGGRKVTARYLFKVSNIQLAGDYKADGCCTCYENSSKSFSVNTVANDTTRLTQVNATASVGHPVVAQLKKTP